MSPAKPKDLSALMSKRLANFKLGDAAIKRLVDRVTIDGLKIGRIDPCIYGICVDYWTPDFPRLEDIDRGISKWEVCPYGIPDWDMFRVRVAFEVGELEGRVTPREFHN